MSLTQTPLAAAAVLLLCLSGFTAAAAHEVWTRGRQRSWRFWALAFCPLAALLAAVPAMRALYPGPPMAAGDVTAPGQSIPLPAHAHGRVVIIAKGKVGREGVKTARFVLSGTEVPTEGTLDSFHRHVRVRHQRQGVGNPSPTFRQQARIPEEADALKVELLQGGLDGPLRVEVYGAPWPVTLLYGLCVLGLLAAAILQVHLRLQRYAVMLGIVLGLGLFAHGFATPEASLAFALSSLAMAILVGAPAAAAAVYAVRRFTGAPAPATRARRR